MGDFVIVRPGGSIPANGRIIKDRAAMDPALVKAHDRLDVVVDKAMGAMRKLSTEKQRLEVLFARYVELSTATR